jgi:spoIIIJ-associated protein
MTGEDDFVEIEGSGETIGEAKWQAMRELERLHPGVDRDAVTFDVLTEGERGLLGVGTSPARVLARVEAPAMGEGFAVSPADASLAELLRDAVERVAEELGARARVTVTEDDETLRVTASATDVGMIIGRDGRTIDAIQHVMSAMAFRRQGPGGKSVEVDAGGYRERRRSRLEETARAAAARALREGAPVRLDPMTAPERRVVHQALQEIAGVETESEGDDPERYVVVLPAQATDPE